MFCLLPGKQESCDRILRKKQWNTNADELGREDTDKNNNTTVLRGLLWLPVRVMKGIFFGRRSGSVCLNKPESGGRIGILWCVSTSQESISEKEWWIRRWMRDIYRSIHFLFSLWKSLWSRSNAETLRKKTIEANTVSIWKPLSPVCLKGLKRAEFFEFINRKGKFTLERLQTQSRQR